jgi:membrane protein DedA with SNARE-associated domain
VILGKGLTPLPFKIVTITSGFLKFNLALFLAASVITRGARFFVVAALIKKFGPQVQPVIERYLGWFTLAFVVLLVGGILAYVGKNRLSPANLRPRRTINTLDEDKRWAKSQLAR